MFVPHFPKDLSVENEAYSTYLMNYFSNNIAFDDADLDAFGFSSILYRAKVVAKSDGVLSGLEEVTFLLNKTASITVESVFKDGDSFAKGDILMHFDVSLSGFSFKFERNILNLLSRLCGVATLVAEYTKVLNRFENKVSLLATRKLLLGPLDKKAFIVGGGLSHRLTQSQALMIKKYHKNLYGADAIFDILYAKDLSSFEFVEYEIHSVDEAYDFLQRIKAKPLAVPLGVMFDNFDSLVLRDLLADLAVNDLLNCDFVEASGGITKNNLKDYDMPHLDFVSVGSITKDSQAIDLSFDLERR